MSDAAPTVLPSLAVAAKEKDVWNEPQTMLGNARTQNKTLQTHPIKLITVDESTSLEASRSNPGRTQANLEEQLRTLDNSSFVPSIDAETPIDKVRRPLKSSVSLERVHDLSEANILHLGAEHIMSPGSETDSLDVTDISLNDCDPDSIGEIEIQKQQILDRLMLCVYEMFAAGEFLTRGESGGSIAPTQRQQTSGTSTSVNKGAKKKRKTGDCDKHSDQEDDNDEDSPKRRKIRDRDAGSEHKVERKFACPYYKRGTLQNNLSRACSGPGWVTVHRVKGHLYRVHAMPLHCRRCYITFDNEAQLTDHSRSKEGCTVTKPEKMEGFDKDQEKALKCRSTMFRAESEEAKWKLVYLILFPDTVLGDLPSPYYELNNGLMPKHTEDHTAQAPELTQFQAYLRRELPRKIRKELQAVLESRIGPIEETLKNELEGIVRDAQERLTNHYLGSTEVSSPSSSRPSGSKQRSEPAQPHRAPDLNDEAPMHSLGPGPNVLAPYLVPPDSTSEPWPHETLVADNTDVYASTSDSAYFTSTGIAQNPVMGDTWDTWLTKYLPDYYIGEDIEQPPADAGSDWPTGQFESSSSYEPRPPETDTGKGKGKGKARRMGP